jgi:hypothetical protein
VLPYPTRFLAPGRAPPRANEVCIADSAGTAIDRRDFGLTCNALLDGRWAVGDDGAINSERELVAQPDAAPATAADGEGPRRP